MLASTISMFCDLMLIDGNVVDFLFTKKTKERTNDDIEVEMSDFIPWGIGEVFKLWGFRTWCDRYLCSNRRSWRQLS